MTQENTQAKPIEALSFEAAIQELEGVVKNLERGETPLEDSIGAYERGIALKKHCETKLREAQAKIEKITVDKDGAIGAEPLDTE